MACLKCGKKTKDEQVFCPECLAVMETYPVKRDIHIQLPNRPAATGQKRSGRKRRNLTPEEQVVFLRSKLRRQNFMLAFLVLALLASLTGLFLTSDAQEEIKKYAPSYSFTD